MAVTQRLSSEAPPRFNALTLRFDDPAQESAFIQEHNRRATKPIRVVVVILAMVVWLQAGMEYYAFLGNGFDGYDLWLEALPLRLIDIVILLIGLGLSWYPPFVRHGQLMVAIFLVALYVVFMIGADLAGPWIERTIQLFNYTVTLALVALGLMIRFAGPLVLAMACGFTPIVLDWMAEPFAPLFITFATVCTMIWVAYSIEKARREVWAASQALRAEKARSESLLRSVLPPSIADRMRGGETLIADSHDEATIVFADIVNFTPLSARMSPEELVSILDEVFAAFDEIAEAHNLEKIKTIGDAYMMAAGLPAERSRDPGGALDAVLAMRDALGAIADRRRIDLSMRAGVHIGPVVAGVIGRSKFVYDLWGDSVNLASRMESTAPPGEIQVTEAVQTRMSPMFDFAPRGEIDVKGKGQIRVWLLQGRK